MNIDWAVVFATLVGPVLAVQAQKFIERSKSKSDRRNRIFEALMTNRATRLSDGYVQALNQIDIEFHSKSDKPVIDRWRALFGELNNGPPDTADRATAIAWVDKCNDRLVDLLMAMGKALGRTHSEEEIRRGIYYPKGRVDLEQSQLAVLSGLQRLLDGTSALKVENVGGAGPSELQIATLRKLHDAYDETGALRVTFTNAPEKGKLN
ncbi:DUF6680 family protein [Bradyrhizobium sp. JYMT SZCCT0428]|uniref:DUF6680 family protein n=1 Tax=Bradyrhizobium sp. JYMT SZCCT0428 TaxID=2807673 RepID=UPI001BA54C2F|nr:DUF6680 family protein [Bradyrhizobium sp. JYMT SZCCT0428]MBR1154810.1 hypothetical protein [Bradyrhizobium sp. JYMT SZCCT0428]